MLGVLQSLLAFNPHLDGDCMDERPRGVGGALTAEALPCLALQGAPHPPTLQGARPSPSLVDLPSGPAHEVMASWPRQNPNTVQVCSDAATGPWRPPVLREAQVAPARPHTRLHLLGDPLYQVPSPLGTLHLKQQTGVHRPGPGVREDPVGPTACARAGKEHPPSDAHLRTGCPSS